MNKASANSRIRPARESGYALLMLIFAVATLILFAAMATPSVLVQGRREKEQEAIWRGNQYVRAIQLYYRKAGRYPQTLEDLTKADIVGTHFLRKTYTDPMNPEDGSWRLIYVSPAGQLIGSVRYRTLQEMALAQGITVPSNSNLGPNGLPQPPSSGNQQATPGQVAPPGQPQQPQSSSSPGLTPAAPLGTPQGLSGAVIGGSLIGVAGKTKRPSLMVYQGGKTYYEWEFIWNPLTSVNAVVQPATGAQTLPGGTSPATPSGFSMTPAPAPQTSPAP